MPITQLEPYMANSSGNFTFSGTTTLGVVGNVKISGGSSGQLLSTDGAGNLSWTPAPNPALSALTDVTLTSPTNTQVLSYNSTSSKWVNSTISAGATLSAVAATTTYYIGLSANTTGSWTDARIDTTNLSYNSGTQTLYATNYNTSSDETLKTNIHTIENALAIINLLRGVGFDWTETGLKSYGVIAQELEKIIPDLVTTDENGRKTVNYNALIGFLIEAMKTQSTQIQSLEERIVKLEEK